MKIIDLLNKIANGEEVPKKIRWGCHIYTWLAVEYKALDELGEPLFSEQTGYTKYSLNDEIEIIEDKPFNERVEEIYKRHIDYIYGKEDKKIEKLRKKTVNIKDDKELALHLHDITKKIDEIIDYINEGDN